MKNQIYRDKKRRLLMQKYELKRLFYKSLSQNVELPLPIRTKAFFELSTLPRNSSLCRIKNRCIKTGRSHAIYKHFKLSRISFREAASQGLLTGVYKASW